MIHVFHEVYCKFQIFLYFMFHKNTQVSKGGYQFYCKRRYERPGPNDTKKLPGLVSPEMKLRILKDVIFYPVELFLW